MIFATENFSSIYWATKKSKPEINYMILKEHINTDLIDAVKKKEKEKALVLRSLNAAIKNAEIAKRLKLSKSVKNTDGINKSFFRFLEKESILSDEEVTDVILSQIKQRRDSIVEFEKGKRIDLVEKEKAEIKILIVYLSEQMSEEEIRKEAKAAIEKTSAKTARDTGKVMAELMKKVKGKADGVLVSKIVKELLAG